MIIEGLTIQLFRLLFKNKTLNIANGLNQIKIVFQIKRNNTTK